MATSPGYQKREDGNVYYVIGGNTMRVHEVLYKKGSELRLDASEGILNLKGRKVYINGTDISSLIDIVSNPDASVATSKDIASAIKTHTDNSKSAVNANVLKVPNIPKLAQLSASLNNLLGILGKTGNAPTNGITNGENWETIDQINTDGEWTEKTIIEKLNKLIAVANLFFG